MSRTRVSAPSEVAALMGEAFAAATRHAVGRALAAGVTPVGEATRRAGAKPASAPAPVAAKKLSLPAVPREAKVPAQPPPKPPAKVAEKPKPPAKAPAKIAAKKAAPKAPAPKPAAPKPAKKAAAARKAPSPRPAKAARK